MNISTNNNKCTSIQLTVDEKELIKYWVSAIAISTSKKANYQLTDAEKASIEYWSLGGEGRNNYQLFKDSLGDLPLDFIKH